MQRQEAYQWLVVEDDESKRYRQKRQKQEDRLAKLMAANMMDRADSIFMSLPAPSLKINVTAELKPILTQT